jgi:hypothetical protein
MVHDLYLREVVVRPLLQAVRAVKLPRVQAFLLLAYVEDFVSAAVTYRDIDFFGPFLHLFHLGLLRVTHIFIIILIT